MKPILPILSIFLSILPSLLLYHSLCAQNIVRRADLGARFGEPGPNTPGAVVREVTKNSPWGKAGLSAGDVIVQWNGEVLDDPDRWSDIVYAMRQGDEVVALVRKHNGSDLQSIKVKLEGLPMEKYDKTEVSYETVYTDKGLAIRVIITYPKGNVDKLPAMFVVGGLSCSSIEVYPGRRESGWTKVLTDLATKSNMVVMRMEKPGVGDSYGNCGESNFHDDINAFENSIKYLKLKSYVDSSKVIIYGSSMGSALAPYLANKMGAAGIISDGTFVKTWFEHMLEIERRILAFNGNTPTQITDKINQGYIPLYYGMLIEKKTYAQVISEKPWLKAYNYHSPAHMYGRPVTYYHQVQDFNFARGWEELKVPVRIIRGTNDWIMSDKDNDIIIDILESNNHKDHRLFRYPGLDHWNMVHKTPADSFHGNPGKWEDNISQIVIDFAWELLGQKKP